jgi:hypothetical protein
MDSTQAISIGFKCDAGFWSQGISETYIFLLAPDSITLQDCYPAVKISEQKIVNRNIELMVKI